MLSKFRPAKYIWMIPAAVLAAVAQPLNAAVTEDRPSLTFEFGHSSDLLRYIVVSPDGKMMASADAAIKLWDLQTGRVLWSLPSPAGGGGGLVFSPDSSLVASVTNYQSVRIWDARTGNLRHTLKHENAVLWVAFGSRDNTLLSGTITNITVWNLDTATATTAAPWRNKVYDRATISPDGHAVARLHVDAAGNQVFNKLDLWDIATGQLRVTADGERLTFSADSKTLATTAARMAQERHQLVHDVNLWDTASGQLRHTFTEPGSDVRGLAFSSDGGMLAYTVGTPAHVYPPDKTEIKVVSLPRGDVVAKLPMRPYEAMQIAFIPGSNSLLCRGMRSVEMWDVVTGKRRRSYLLTDPRKKLSAATLTNDGALLRFANLEERQEANPAGSLREPHSIGVIRNFDLLNCRLQPGQLLIKTDEYGSRTDSSVNDLAFSANSSIMAVASGSPGMQDILGRLRGNYGEVIVTSTEAPPVTKRWLGYAHPAQAVAISPDGRKIVSIGRDNRPLDLPTSPERSTTAAAPKRPRRPLNPLTVTKIKLWDAQTGNLLSTLPAIGPAAVFCDNRTVAVLDPVVLPPTPTTAGTSAAVENSGQEMPWNVDFWDTLEFKSLRTVKLNGLQGVPQTIAMANDQRTFVTINSRNLPFNPQTGESRPPATHILQEWDARSGTLLRTITLEPNAEPITKPGPSWARPDSPRYFLSQGRVGAIDEHGAIRLWDAKNGRLLSTLIVLDGTDGQPTPDWIAYTPDGYYDASPGANRYIRWRVGDILWPAEKYGPQYHRPAVLQRALQGKD